jgi:hypothetical protein
VFEVVETVGEKEGIPGWRLKKRCKDPCRNPVSALNNINGYVLHSNGPKVSRDSVFKESLTYRYTSKDLITMIDSSHLLLRMLDCLSLR